MYNILLNVLQLLFLQQNISVVFLMLRDHYPHQNLLHKYYKDLMPNNSYIPFLSTFLYLISAVLFSFQFHFLYLRYNKPHLFHLLFRSEERRVGKGWHIPFLRYGFVTLSCIELISSPL